MTLPDGSIYTGEFKDGFFQGYGKLTKPDGTIYTGQFKNSWEHGQGTKIYPDGSKYTGEFKDARENGLGTMSFPDGGIYVGQFEYGYPHGQGTLTLPDGLMYAGEFKEGIEHGRGTITYSDGSEYTGEFTDGNEEGKGRLIYADGAKYEGRFKNGKPDGKGNLSLPDGTEYSGEFEKESINGVGTKIYPDGTRYTGEFRKFDEHGQGTLNFHDGGVYVGQFSDGYPDGEGILSMPDNRIYVGQFKAGMPHGQGTLTMPHGEAFTGQFIEGELHQETQAYSSLNTVDESDNKPGLEKGEENADKVTPSFTIQLSANGYPASSAPGPSVPVGNAVNWEYKVTNNGNVDLKNITLTDHHLGNVCTIENLPAGTNNYCIISDTSKAGQFKNTVTATVSYEGRIYTEDDTSHYFGVNPHIHIQQQVSVNGVWYDADSAASCSDPRVPQAVSCTASTLTECGDCKGVVSVLTLKYSGKSGATVNIYNKKGYQLFQKKDILSGEQMRFLLADTEGKLTSNISIYLNGFYHGTIDTSCELPIGPRLKVGSFQVMEAKSSAGSALCAVTCEAGTSVETPKAQAGNCEGKVTELNLIYHGQFQEHVTVKDTDSRELFIGNVYPQDKFGFSCKAKGETCTSEVKVYVNWRYQTTIKTDCSVDIGPGYRSGDFEIVGGMSSSNGPLVSVQPKELYTSGQENCRYVAQSKECSSDEVKFRFIIKNEGNVELVNIQLTDKGQHVSEVVSGCKTPRILASGEKYTCMSDRIPVNNGLVVNSAQVTGDFIFSRKETVTVKDTDDVVYCGIPAR